MYQNGGDNKSALLEEPWEGHESHELKQKSCPKHFALHTDSLAWERTKAQTLIRQQMSKISLLTLQLS
jgi:hypothetical protein